jgi:hypothetical protein
MDLHDLIRICKAYKDLGWSVQEQLDAYVDDPSNENLNQNAVDMIRAFLAGVADAVESDNPAAAGEIGAILDIGGK